MLLYTPLLGLTKCVNKDKDLTDMFDLPHAELVLAPNSEPVDTNRRSDCTSHGGVDDDKATVSATLARMLNVTTKTGFQFEFNRSASSLKDRRQSLEQHLS